MSGQVVKVENLKESFFRGFKYKVNPRFCFYRPTLQIEISTPLYQLKTAENYHELIKVFELRYRNFLADTLLGENLDGFDSDEFDSLCDHLVISCKKTGEIVGTYRLMTNLMTSKFYSETEFELSSFLKRPGIKLELGRACVDQGHRHGAVIDLLWRGLAQYARLSKAHYLFGCSSVKTVSLLKAFKLKRYFSTLEHEEWIDQLRVKEKYAINSTELDFDYDVSEVKQLLPALLRTYISAGAMVLSSPAFDKEFECMDFLTILDLSKINKNFERRYF